MNMEEVLDKIRFDPQGLVPAVVQDVKTREVLMVAYMNREALERTIKDGVTWFFSRSRQELWQKGATSGNVQKVAEIRYDCDFDTLLVLVEALGPACHTGHASCFFRSLAGEIGKRQMDPDDVYGQEGPGILYELMRVIIERRKDRPQGSYTTYLFDSGLDKILKKVGEETAEVIIASKNEGKGELVYELADLMYHLMVLMAQKGVSLGDVFAELKGRFGAKGSPSPKG